jgi:hypothetical protein
MEMSRANGWYWVRTGWLAGDWIVCEWRPGGWYLDGYGYINKLKRVDERQIVRPATQPDEVGGEREPGWYWVRLSQKPGVFYDWKPERFDGRCWRPQGFHLKDIHYKIDGRRIPPPTTPAAAEARSE